MSSDGTLPTKLMTTSEPWTARRTESSSRGENTVGTTTPRSPMTFKCRHSMSSPRNGMMHCVPSPAAGTHTRCFVSVQRHRPSPPHPEKQQHATHP